MKHRPAIVCEIVSPSASMAADLAEVAVACANALGHSLAVRSLHVGGSAPAQPTLTLQLPVELAASQHRIWCLVCRLACFCPNARVSILVLGGGEFAARAPRARKSIRRPA